MSAYHRLCLTNCRSVHSVLWKKKSSQPSTRSSTVSSTPFSCVSQNVGNSTPESYCGSRRWRWTSGGDARRSIGWTGFGKSGAGADGGGVGKSSAVLARSLEPRKKTSRWTQGPVVEGITDMTVGCSARMTGWTGTSGEMLSHRRTTYQGKPPMST